MQSNSFQAVTFPHKQSKRCSPRAVWPWLCSVNVMASLPLSLQPHIRQGVVILMHFGGRVQMQKAAFEMSAWWQELLTQLWASSFLQNLWQQRTSKSWKEFVWIYTTFVRLFYGPASFLTAIRFCILRVWDSVSKISFILKNISHIAVFFSKELHSYTSVQVLI